MFDVEQWQTIKEILADLREDPSLRDSGGLEERCGGDPELLREVYSLLEYEDRLEGFIDEPLLTLQEPCGGDVVEIEEQERQRLGERIGPYRILAVLGIGGMGTVYRAQREEDFEQQVALKVVRRGWGGEEMVRHFESERQILARLEHPHIARLLDGGTTATGAPYFAMELVEGEPIDEYCDSRDLSIVERVKLFLPVCSALATAHRNLVIHRDLKPANILVDHEGRPKLLDFGIAQLLGTRREESAADFPLAMTRGYASPEQIQGQGLSTASDLYSLGVSLHRVLTGLMPQRRKSEDPEDAVPYFDENWELVFKFPPMEPASTWLPELRGDLDSIVAKALEDDPVLRYGSADQLAEDLRCYLEDRPVQAHPQTVLYRARKYVRRHRWGVANATFIVLLALTFTFMLAHQLRETERSRDRAEQISGFVIDLFQSASPERVGGREPTVRDLLDRGSRQLDSAFQDEPEVRAELLLKVGEVYARLGDYDQAERLLEESLQLQRELGGEPDRRLATVLSDLGMVHYQTGDLESAERRLAESIALRRQLGEEENLIKPLNNLAGILMAQDRYAEAEVIYREGLEQRRARAQAHPEDVVAQRNLATSLRSLATALMALEDLESAEPLLAESLALRQQIYGERSSRAATVVMSLGRLEHRRGRLEAAEERMVEGLAIRREELGEDHLHTALARRNLARVLMDQGRDLEAQGLLQQALGVLETVRPADDEDRLEVEAWIAELATVAP
ncbi:MAG: serine/threonine-protein kinase [Acidobacteriota bacterium]